VRLLGASGDTRLRQRQQLGRRQPLDLLVLKVVVVDSHLALFGFLAVEVVVLEAIPGAEVKSQGYGPISKRVDTLIHAFKVQRWD